MHPSRVSPCIHAPVLNHAEPWVNFFGPLVLFLAIFTGCLMLGSDSFGHAFPVLPGDWCRVRPLERVARPPA